MSQTVFPICFSSFSKNCEDEGKTDLSCYLPRFLDHFRPVGPWAELLKTAMVSAQVA